MDEEKKEGEEIIKLREGEEDVGKFLGGGSGKGARGGGRRGTR
jgi:hypothetical protein